jgi:hypothetical protein
MLRRTRGVLAVVVLTASLASGCSGGDDDTKDDKPSTDPTLAGPSESLVAPPGTADPDVLISKTEVCADQPVSGGKADGRFYGSVTSLAGGTLDLTTQVENPAKKSPAKRKVSVLVDSAGSFVALFPVYGEGEVLTLTRVEASGVKLEAPAATLEVQSLEPAPCEALNLPVPPIAEDD